MNFFKRKSDLEKRVAELEQLMDLIRGRLRAIDLWRKDSKHHNDVMEKWAEALLKAVSK
jgi:hypothetical protein